MVADHTELTEDEAELYDRQIRLWGLDSQKRLRSARVLIIGLRGFGAEVAKNIILSGVKSVTLLDDELVNEEDGCAQFLAPRSALNQPRAEASLTRAQALNPMVHVSADKGNISDKPDEYFANFDVVVATECQLRELKRINTACRMRNIKFFCGDVFGLFGYLFADLQIHEFAEEITKHPMVKQVPNIRKPEPVKVVVKQTETFVPLIEALSVDWSAPANAKRLNKMDYAYFLIRVLQEFRATKNRDPEPKHRDSDIKELEELAKTILAGLSVPVEKIPVSSLSLVFSEVSPTCAIMGGVLAQEVIKAVSQKEAPHNNFFFFNPETRCGFVETHSNPA